MSRLEFTQFTIRINPETAREIAKTGTGPTQWFREAASLRVELEKRKETPASRIDRQLSKIRETLDLIHRENALNKSELIRQRQALDTCQEQVAQCDETARAAYYKLDELEHEIEKAITASGKLILHAIFGATQPQKKPKEPDPPARYKRTSF